METALHRLGLVVVGILMIVCLALLPPLVTAAMSQTNPSNSGTVGTFDAFSTNSNAVARGMSGIGSAAQQVGGTAVTTTRSISYGAVHVIGSTVSFGAAIGTGIGNGALAIVRGIGTGIVITVQLPGNVLRHVSNVSVGNSLIKPADHEQTPAIDTSVYAFAPQQTVQLAAAKPVAAVKKPTAVSPTVHWPIHGAITTLFGVPEPPYQPIHTGIDISDGAAAGVTPVHPYRAGTVIDTIYSSSGLGNHVIVDHGGGITSVYGHLDSIAVKKGQAVSINSVLGHEGTTGVSTGVHLHFEVRVNDTPVNPFDYISGRP